ncbi:MAG: PhzF family phenazine biosynthesis protein [Thermodesulfobacteriota bacterium]
MRIWQVDAFTDRPFSGNPAGVCVLKSPADVTWMQQMALEMNLSETAFLHPEEDGYRLRWFTPASEVEMCGHATLASAHVLWAEGFLPRQAQARFFTLSGLLWASLGEDGLIELVFPQTPPRETTPPPGLVEALGINPIYTGRSRFDYLFEVTDEEIVRGLVPDFNRMAKCETRGVMVTSRSSSNEFDFVSRFFAPAVGIDEDPVTGSAHCCLGPYWRDKLGREELHAYQASARGGRLRIRFGGDRVYLGGRAVTIFTAELSEAAEGTS